MSNTQLLSHDASGVTFADPMKPSFTVRFKTTRNTKSLNGVSTDNYLHEVIVNDTNAVTIGAQSANDALSVRIRISGSIDSKARLAAIVNSIATQLPAWAGENVFVGFEPMTVPVNPA